MKKLFFYGLVLIVLSYLIGMIILYFYQEKLTFHPTPWDKEMYLKDYEPLEEHTIKTSDSTSLHGVLFKTKSDSCKGLIYFLHGNAGNVQGWASVSSFFVERGYDFFILDYRGFGKSEGRITNPATFLEDTEYFYQELSPKYADKKIILMGYSIGSGPSAYLASKYKPNHLFLLSPYANLKKLMHSKAPFFPSAIARYNIPTDSFVKKTQCPISIFHGEDDATIPVENSYALKKFLKPNDTLIIYPDFGHNAVIEHPMLEEYFIERF